METDDHRTTHTNHDKQFNPGSVTENSKGSESPPEGEDYLLITEPEYTQVKDKNQVCHALNPTVLAWR